MKKIIENENIGEYIRSACLDCLVILVATGIKSREEVISYFAALFRGGLNWEYSPIWNHLVWVCADLHPEELSGDICKAYEEGFVDDGHITLRDVDKIRAKTLDSVLADCRNDPRHTMISDTIKEMEWWACFRGVHSRFRDLSKQKQKMSLLWSS